MRRDDAIELRPIHLAGFLLAVFAFVVFAIVGRDHVERKRATQGKKL